MTEPSVRTRSDRMVTELTDRAIAAGLDASQAGKAVWRTIAGAALGDTVDADRLDLWFDADALPLTDVDLPLIGAAGTDRTSAEELMASYERTAPLRVPGTAKRDAGIYYTPPALAELVVEQTVQQLVSHGRPPTSWRVVDPASGAGVFGIAVVRAVVAVLTAAGMAEDDAREHTLTTSIYLVDADPLAVAVARCLLLSEFGASASAIAALERHLLCGDAVLGGPDVQAPSPGGVDWVGSFPEVFAEGGFDAVVGNPPWGAIKPSAREYAATVDPGLLRLDGRSMRARLEEVAAAQVGQLAQAHQARSYAARLRQAPYVHQGAGDTEFYRYFVELAHALAGPHGVVGLLIPSAFQRTAGAAPLRRLLLDHGTIELWLDFVNSRGIFTIHKMFRFALLVWRQGGDGGIARACFGLTTVRDAEVAARKSAVALSSAYLAGVSGELRTIPDVRSADDAELYGRLHAAHPGLGTPVSGAWSVRFRRELDMTNDAHLFVSADQARSEGAAPQEDGTWSHPRLGPLLPVFEGRMVHQFDAAAKGHVDGHGRSARWESLGPLDKHIRPRFLIPADQAAQRRISRTPRAAFCDVTGHANERTILAAVVPAIAVCGNKVPTCDFDGADDDVTFLWAAIANSFVIDWLARRRVSTTMNFFHWYELPFPRHDPASDSGQRLIQAARALSTDPGRPWATTLSERALLRAEIDIEVMRLFGLDPRDATVILGDFPLLDRGAPEGHRGVTRDLVLAGVCAAAGVTDARVTDLGLQAGEGPRSIADRVEWHAAAGATAYVPGEFALATARTA